MICLLSSGSKAEGLDLPGRDFDIMMLFKLWEVYEDKPKDNEDVLMLDPDTVTRFCVIEESI